MVAVTLWVLMMITGDGGTATVPNDRYYPSQVECTKARDAFLTLNTGRSRIVMKCQEQTIMVPK